MVALFLLVGFAALTVPGDAGNGMSAGRIRIVDAVEATARLPNTVVLDARSAKEFAAGHVPGARRVDWREWTLEKPGFLGALFGDPARWGRVPPPDARLENRLRALGLSNTRPVLVVGTPGGWGEEGRVAWNLLYWGAAEVWLLDGGFPAWRADAMRPVETGAARGTASGDFVLRVRPERRIEKAALKAALDAKGAVLLDARTPAEFGGETVSGQKRGGRLPGARLVPERGLYDGEGRYVGADELRRLAGLGPEGENGSRGRPITYCTGGVRSALLAVLLEARLGVLAANYDGSLWEWSADPSLPLEK
ncbi:MAG: rhodanese-like domain-containing protein [Thermoanaerobaculia bacterium]|nr:rhodanese-like domain-containing protein [Thermoanaerobaculia bacterium]